MNAQEKPFVSLAMVQRMSPDNDYDTTVETLYADYRAGEYDEIWDLQNIEVPLVDPLQLIDDPDDEEAESKVEAIREATRSGAQMPPVFVIHHPEDQHPFFLIEGRHRYNAAYREEADILRAWVAHPDCDCGRAEHADTDTQESQPHD